MIWPTGEEEGQHEDELNDPEEDIDRDNWKRRRTTEKKKENKRKNEQGKL